MVIAISTDTNDGLTSRVGHRLGHSPYFALVELDGDQVEQIKFLPNPFIEQHDHAALAEYIQQQGAQVMISGGRGRHISAEFAARGIQRACGAHGTVGEAIGDFLAGELNDPEHGCGHHDHDDHQPHPATHRRSGEG